MDLLAAARETLREAGTARIRHALRSGAPDGPASDAGTATGVADLQARRARLDGRAETVVDGDAHLERRADDTCFLRRPAATATTDVLWLLREDVVMASAAERLAGASVGGAPVARYGLHVVAPGGKAYAEVWLDGLGRAVLFAQAQPVLPPLPLAIVGRALERLVAGAFSAAGRPVWRTTELWDFGCPADIAMPPPAVIVAQRDDAL